MDIRRRRPLSPGQHKYLATRKEADDFQIGSRITVLADDAFPVKPGSIQEFPNMLRGGPFE